MGIKATTTSSDAEYFTNVFKRSPKNGLIRGTIHLFISPKFEQLLQQISAKSQLRKLLLLSSIDSKCIKENNPNFLDISLENDVLFISHIDRRTLENKAKSLTSPASLSSSTSSPSVSSLNFWQLLTAGPLTQFWGKDLFVRTVSRAGKVLNKLFDLDSLKIQTHEVETFLNDLKVQAKQQTKKTFLSFEIVKGDAIAYYYNEVNNQQQGTLGNSCMKFADRNHLFNLYTKNPNQISLLVKHDTGLTKKIHNNLEVAIQAIKGKKMPIDTKGTICGRAILWTVNGKTYIDRVYYTGEKVLQDFIKYANAKGFISVYSGSWGGYKYHLNFNTNEEFKVQLSNWNFHAYPYMDSLKYLNVKEGILTNISDISKHRMHLRGTGGIHTLYPGSKVKKCNYRRKFYKEAEVVQCSMESQKHCNIHDVLYVPHLDKFAFPNELESHEIVSTDNKGNITYAKSNDVVYSDFYGKNILKNQSRFSKAVSSFVFIDDSEEKLQKQTRLHSSLTEEFKNRFIKIKPNVGKIMQQNGYFISDEDVKELIKTNISAFRPILGKAITTDNGFIINGIFVLASAIEIVEYAGKPKKKQKRKSFYEHMASKEIPASWVSAWDSTDH